MTRKHRGIIQEGDNKGRLRKGFFYSGKRTKNGLPIIKEKKQNQNGGTGTRNSMLRLLKQASAFGSATVGLGLEKARTEGAKKAASGLLKNPPSLLNNPPSLLTNPPSLLTNPPRGINLSSDFPSIIRDRHDSNSIKVIPGMGIVGPKELFVKISGQTQDSLIETSTKIINDFIHQTIDFFFYPIDEVELIRESNPINPIFLLRIILKTTRSLIESLAQSNTEEQLKNTFNKNFNKFLNEEIPYKDRQYPLTNIFSNNPINQTLKININVKSIIENRDNLYTNRVEIKKLLKQYINKLPIGKVSIT